MTLPFDIRVVSAQAKIGFLFAQRGIVPEACSTYFLPRLIGHSNAMDLFMTAQVRPATDKAFRDLWHAILPSPEETLAYAMKLAQEIATKNSAVSMAVLKNLVWRGADSAEEQHLRDSLAMACVVAKSPV